MMHLVFHPTSCIAMAHCHCFQFLLGITVVPSEIEVNDYAKFGGGGGGGVVSKVHYGLCEIGEFTVKFTDVLALGTKLRLRG